MASFFGEAVFAVKSFISASVSSCLGTNLQPISPPEPCARKEREKRDMFQDAILKTHQGITRTSPQNA